MRNEFYCLQYLSIYKKIKNTAHADFERLYFFQVFGGKIIFFKVNGKGLQISLFFKKMAHAYFKRPYFSKSFGGKIKHGQTDVKKEKNY